MAIPQAWLVMIQENVLEMPVHLLLLVDQIQLIHQTGQLVNQVLLMKEDVWN